MLYSTGAIAALLFFLAGYSIGRRIGTKEGYEQASSYLPLELKENILRNTRCPLCNKQN